MFCWELDAQRINELLGSDPIGAIVKDVAAKPKPAVVTESFFPEEDKKNDDGGNEIDDLIST